MCTLRIISAASGLIVTLLSTVSTAQTIETSSIPLPTQAQEQYLRTVSPTVTRGAGPAATTTVQVKTVPSDSVFSSAIVGGKPVKQPLQSANEIIILLDPSLSGQQIQAALAENQLDLVETLPMIGGVVVDASRRLGSKALTTTAAATVPKAKSAELGKLIDTLAKDNRFLSVAPNSVISTFALRSAVKPVADPPQVGATAERTDWGIRDARFDKVWDQMVVPVKIGVIDVGFAAHEDLNLVNALGEQWLSNDHGNHVAGIMCAQHNGVGVRGALKNCTVVASSGKLLLTGDSRVEGGGVSPFVAQFSEYIGTLLDFIERQPNVRVINLSLGYNWMPNFNIDPRGQDEERVRNEIKSQGRFVASVLAVAKNKNIAVVMAAGNDSSTLASPLNADLASPFSYGSRLVERADGWSNGVIVEAYDEQHRRPPFSNIDGHVACPGVDVLSALASGPKEYGQMSGTSMASPYCAAGLLTILTLRPELGLRGAIECMRSSPSKIDNRIPRFDVEYAVSQCKK